MLKRVLCAALSVLMVLSFITLPAATVSAANGTSISVNGRTVEFDASGKYASVSIPVAEIGSVPVLDVVPGKSGASVETAGLSAVPCVARVTVTNTDSTVEKYYLTIEGVYDTSMSNFWAIANSSTYKFGPMVLETSKNASSPVPANATNFYCDRDNFKFYTDTSAKFVTNSTVISTPKADNGYVPAGKAAASKDTYFMDGTRDWLRFTMNAGGTVYRVSNLYGWPNMPADWSAAPAGEVVSLLNGTSPGGKTGSAGNLHCKHYNAGEQVVIPNNGWTSAMGGDWTEPIPAVELDGQGQPAGAWKTYLTAVQKFWDFAAYIIVWDDKPVASGANADLSSASYVVNGVSRVIPGFTADNYEYAITLPEGTDSLDITALTADPSATISTDLSDIALDPAGGSIDIEVVSAGGIMEKVYTIDYDFSSVSSNTNLAWLRYSADGGALKAVNGFAAGVYNYNVQLADTVTTVSVQAGAADVINAKLAYSAQPVSVPGSVTVTVTAENGDTQDYTVNFTHGTYSTTIPADTNVVAGRYSGFANLTARTSIPVYEKGKSRLTKRPYFGFTLPAANTLDSELKSVSFDVYFTNAYSTAITVGLYQVENTFTNTTNSFKCGEDAQTFPQPFDIGNYTVQNQANFDGRVSASQPMATIIVPANTNTLTKFTVTSSLSDNPDLYKYVKARLDGGRQLGVALIPHTIPNPTTDIDTLFTGADLCYGSKEVGSGNKAEDIPLDGVIPNFGTSTNDNPAGILSVAQPAAGTAYIYKLQTPGLANTANRPKVTLKFDENTVQYTKQNVISNVSSRSLVSGTATWTDTWTTGINSVIYTGMKGGKSICTTGYNAIALPQNISTKYVGMPYFMTSKTNTGIVPGVAQTKGQENVMKFDLSAPATLYVALKGDFSTETAGMAWPASLYTGDSGRVWTEDSKLSISDASWRVFKTSVNIAAGDTKTITVGGYKASTTLADPYIMFVGFEDSYKQDGVTSLTVNPERTGSLAIAVAPTLSGPDKPIYTDRTNFTFSHLGAKLKGLTYIQTPIGDTPGRNSSDPVRNAFMFSEKEYFNFTANKSGTVYVVSGYALHNVSATSKGNYAPAKGWTTLANAVYPANPPSTYPYYGGGTSANGSWTNVYPDYEPNAQYYMTRTQWNNGIVSDMSGTNMANAKWVYAYGKKFGANTAVSIPVYGLDGVGINENIAVFVKWDGTSADVSSLSYTPVGGAATPIAECDAATASYTVALPYGTTGVSLAAAAVDANAAVTYDKASLTTFPGSIKATITSEDGQTVKDYTVNFVMMPNTTNTNLVSLSYTPSNGTGRAVPGFSTAVYEYNVELPSGASAVSILAVTESNKASVAYSTESLSTLPGSIVATVTAQDGNTKQTYTVNFTPYNPVGAVTNITRTEWNGNTNGSTQIQAVTGVQVAPFVNIAPANKVTVPSDLWNASIDAAVSGGYRDRQYRSYIDRDPADASANGLTLGNAKFNPTGMVYIEGTSSRFIGEDVTKILTRNDDKNNTAPSGQPASLVVDNMYQFDISRPATVYIAIGGNPSASAAPNWASWTKLDATYRMEMGSGRAVDANNYALDNWTTVVTEDGKQKYNAGTTDNPNWITLEAPFYTVPAGTTSGGTVYRKRFEAGQVKIPSFNAGTGRGPNVFVVWGDDPVSTDATLSRLYYFLTAPVTQYASFPFDVDGFTPYVDGTKSYNVTLPAGTKTISLGAQIADGGEAIIGGNANGTLGRSVDVSSGSATTTVVTRAEDGVTSNTYTIHFTVETSAITGLTINTPSNLTQAENDMSAVNFSVTTTPESGIDASTVEWYVDAVKQPATGLTFTFTPDAAGSYVIQAKVGADVVSETRTVVVTPVQTEPSISLNYSQLTLAENVTSGAVLVTVDGENQNYSVESDDESVAFWDNGKVKTLAAGTATLTFTAEQDGTTAILTVTVVPHTEVVDVAVVNGTGSYDAVNKKISVEAADGVQYVSFKTVPNTSATVELVGTSDSDISIVNGTHVMVLNRLAGTKVFQIKLTYGGISATYDVEVTTNGAADDVYKLKTTRIAGATPIAGTVYGTIDLEQGQTVINLDGKGQTSVAFTTNMGVSTIWDASGSWEQTAETVYQWGGSPYVLLNTKNGFITVKNPVTKNVSFDIDINGTLYTVNVDFGNRSDIAEITTQRVPTTDTGKISHDQNGQTTAVWNSSSYSITFTTNLGAYATWACAEEPNFYLVDSGKLDAKGEIKWEPAPGAVTYYNFKNGYVTIPRPKTGNQSVLNYTAEINGVISVLQVTVNWI